MSEEGLSTILGHRVLYLSFNSLNTSDTFSPVSVEHEL